MAITELASFMTSDGKVFTTVEEARAHELGIEMASSIEEIAARFDLPSRTTSTLKKWIPMFVAEMNYVPAPAAVTFEEEANAMDAYYPVEDDPDTAPVSSTAIFSDEQAA